MKAERIWSWGLQHIKLRSSAGGEACVQCEVNPVLLVTAQTPEPACLGSHSGCYFTRSVALRRFLNLPESFWHMIDELHVSLLFFAVLKFLPEYGWNSRPGSLWWSPLAREGISAKIQPMQKETYQDHLGCQSSREVSQCPCLNLFISSSESSVIKIPRKIPHSTYVPCDLFLLEDNIPQAKLLSRQARRGLLVPNASKYEEDLWPVNLSVKSNYRNGIEPMVSLGALSSITWPFFYPASWLLKAPVNQIIKSVYW